MSARSKAKLFEKPADERTCRQIGYWIARGLSKEEAAEKVRMIQTTNGVEYYESKGYSHEEAQKHQIERNENWLLSLMSNPDNNDIGYLRSHSLKRYIERAAVMNQ